jgi:hypothetical protein
MFIMSAQNNSKGDTMTEAQRDLIIKAGGNENDIKLTEAGEVSWDWEMLAS